MLTFVTFLLLCYSAVLCNSHGVVWTIVDKRVMIGHNLDLYCNESSLAAINCCPKHSTRRWFGGPNRELLYKNGICSYPSKYTSRLEDGGFYLTIHNVEVKDLNVSYSCSVAIYEYTNILRPHYDIVAETSMSTKLSMSTEPSISGNITISDYRILYVAFILVILMLLILVGGIAYYHRRGMKKLLMEKFRSNNASTTPENGKGNINMESVRSCTISEKGKENIRMESGEVTEYQIKTENSDQKSFEEEPLIEAATTTENTDQKEIIEPGMLTEDQTKTEN